MTEAPEKLYVCTKGSFSSDFREGIIFGSSEESKPLGTVEYIRKDVVEKMLLNKS